MDEVPEASDLGSILYLGNGPRGSRCLEALLAAREPVAGVLGHPGSETSELAALAASAGLPYRAPKSPNEPALLDWVGVLGCRLAVMAGYAKILKPRFLERFPDGVFNLHGGPLPEYRGGSPLNWQILRGERAIGISVVVTDAGIDSGPVLARESFPLGPDETIDEVVTKTLPRFQRMLLGVLDARRRGVLHPEPQDETRARYFAKRRPEDGWIDWRTRTAAEVHDLVRSLSGSYPGAFTFHRGRKIVIERSRCLEETVIGPPGRVLARRADGVEVACADRALLVVAARDAAGSARDAREELPPREASFDFLPAGAFGADRAAGS
jgi:methionyl-tRNA formyltransferase